MGLELYDVIEDLQCGSYCLMGFGIEIPGIYNQDQNTELMKQ
jgi:hypothetical protein